MPPTSPAVELILARLRESGDFPAMAKTVGTVSALTSAEDTSISALADTVLQDYGLAQKLLRLVNTLAYAQHGQVTTVSRAVLLMGFDRVRIVATGLMIFERLQAQAKTPALLDALNMSFYSAVLGRSIADRTGLADKEETFISALFHNLGRTLVALYLPAESKAIRAEEEQQQDAAVLRVLGMSYSSIGVAVARSLNLPERLLQSMNRVTGSQTHASMTDEEKLGAMATLSNGVADALATSASPKNKKQAIERLVKSVRRPVQGARHQDDGHADCRRRDRTARAFDDLQARSRRQHVRCRSQRVQGRRDRVRQRRAHQQRFRGGRPDRHGAARICRPRRCPRPF